MSLSCVTTRHARRESKLVERKGWASARLLSELLKVSPILQAHYPGLGVFSKDPKPVLGPVQPFVRVYEPLILKSRYFYVSFLT